MENLTMAIRNSSWKGGRKEGKERRKKRKKVEK